MIYFSLAEFSFNPLRLEGIKEAEVTAGAKVSFGFKRFYTAPTLYKFIFSFLFRHLSRQVMAAEAIYIYLLVFFGQINLKE